MKQPLVSLGYSKTPGPARPAPARPATIGQATDRAIDLLAAGREDEIAPLLGPLAQSNADEPRLWQMLALAARAQGDNARALPAIERAATLAPHDAKIALAHASLLLEAGLPSAARWIDLSRRYPGDEEIALSVAAALVAERRDDAAETLLAGRLARDPAWLRGHDALSTRRWLRGDRDTFDRDFAKAAAVRPGDLALRLAWYRAVARTGLHDRAAAIVADGRRRFGERIELDAADAFLATETGDDGRADRLFARVVALDDEGTKAAYVRHAIRTGRIDEAETVALALTRGASAGVAWPYLSTIWRLQGDERAAWLDGQSPYIGVHELPLTPEQLGAAAQVLRSLHASVERPPEQSMRGGTQTEGSLFARVDPELAPIRQAVLAAVRAYVDTLPPPDPAHPLLGAQRRRLRFAGSWSVRLASSGHHIDHSHPLGWISSALYIALPSKAQLGAPPAGWLSLGGAPSDLRVDVAPLATVQPRPARLVLFPSTMWHKTLPFDDGERLTVAFDLAPLSA